MAAAGTLSVARGGRPKGRVLTEVVKFRVSAEEFDEWCRAAIRARIGFNQWVREMVRKAHNSGGLKTHNP